MDHQRHPTNPEWIMFDPLVVPPPRGEELLLINEGGVLIKGQWTNDCIAWCRKPKIPASVKARASQTRKEVK